MNLVCGYKSWDYKAYSKLFGFGGEQWAYCNCLDVVSVKLMNPERIFFLHWSWIVPNEIVDNYECIGFHMTNLPYGRGGTPLQNLIVRGHEYTSLTAFRMDRGIDTGGIYLKGDLYIGDGTAESIYKECNDLAVEMIGEIIKKNLKPVTQTGETTVFRRRKPEDSQIPEASTLDQTYDFIRMLDAEGYPHAFLKNGLTYEFTGANLYDGYIEAKVRIS